MNGDEKVFLIIGLSGTGKTTTTFTTQNDSLPVQDDFVALMPAGQVYATEDGCFAKTFSLDPDFEPNIYGAVTKPTAYLENVFQDEAGHVNFFEESYTKNGRSVFSLADLSRYADARHIGRVDYLLILNWNENIIPAVSRLSQTQAAAYFMLGETTGTSAGGKSEEGKFLRVPGTNPFFPLRHGLQGNRFLELLDSHPIEVYLMNTGRVGGKADDDRSKKVKIPHSSAVVKAIAEESIKWDGDADFGYEVAVDVPGIDDPDLLQPRRLYERQGRMARVRRVHRALQAGAAGDPGALHGPLGRHRPRGRIAEPSESLGSTIGPSRRGTLAVMADQQSSPPTTSERVIRRTIGNQRILGGVCGGLARYLGVDPILLRIAAVVLALTGGVGVLLYVVAWIAVPEEEQGDTVGPVTALPWSSGQVIVGTALIAAGSLLIVDRIVPWFGRVAGPLVLIGLGVAVLVWGARR